MKPILCAWLTIFLALASAPLWAADSDAPTFTVQVPGADNLVIAVPPGWKHTVDRPPPGIPPTIDLTLPGGAILKVTFMQDPKGLFTKADELDKLVTKGNRQYVADSVEKSLVLHRLTSNAGPGVYFVVTDPKLAGATKLRPGEFRFVSAGAQSLGRQAVIFSLFSNQRDNDEYRQALDFLTNKITVDSGNH